MPVDMPALNRKWKLGVLVGENYKSRVVPADYVSHYHCQLLSEASDHLGKGTMLLLPMSPDSFRICLGVVKHRRVRPSVYLQHPAFQTPASSSSLKETADLVWQAVFADALVSPCNALLRHSHRSMTTIRAPVLPAAVSYQIRRACMFRRRQPPS
jgi:hypothetical protein